MEAVPLAALRGLRLRDMQADAAWYADDAVGARLQGPDLPLESGGHSSCVLGLSLSFARTEAEQVETDRKVGQQEGGGACARATLRSGDVGSWVAAGEEPFNYLPLSYKT